MNNLENIDFEKRPLNNNCQKEIIIKLNNGKLSNYYNCIEYFYSKKDYLKFIIDDELNDLDNELYFNIEKRKFYGIFWSTFTSYYDFLNSFFIFFNKDYKIYQIKVMNYINLILFSLIINISFYNDNTMHKIYTDNGEYNILNRLIIVILTNLTSNILSALFEKFFLCQDKFIELKIYIEDEEDKGKEVKEAMAKKVYKILLIKMIFCLIFTFFLDFFGWYYISCFFAVYLKTQKSIILDFLL